MAEVRAEITANVWQVPASVGDTVAEGDELAILESMKMEIPVEATASGRVVSIEVAEGDSVSDGTPVVTLEV